MQEACRFDFGAHGTGRETAFLAAHHLINIYTMEQPPVKWVFSDSKLELGQIYDTVDVVYLLGLLANCKPWHTGHSPDGTKAYNARYCISSTQKILSIKMEGIHMSMLKGDIVEQCSSAQICESTYVFCIIEAWLRHIHCSCICYSRATVISFNMFSKAQPC